MFLTLSRRYRNRLWLPQLSLVAQPLLLTIVAGLQQYVLSFLQAEKRMIEAEENKEYLPIDGLADFKKATLQLLLGSGHAAIKEVRPSFRMCTYPSYSNAALLCDIAHWLDQATSAELSDCKMLAT